MYGVDNTSSPQLTVLTATFEIRNGKERGLRGMHNFFFFCSFFVQKGEKERTNAGVVSFGEVGWKEEDQRGKPERGHGRRKKTRY